MPHTESAGRSPNTDLQSSLDLPTGATLLRRRVPFQQVATLSGSFRGDSNRSEGIPKNLLRKSSLPEGQSFLNTLMTSQKYWVGTIYGAMQLSRGFPKKRLLSQLNRDPGRLRLLTTLYVKDVKCLSSGMSKRKSRGQCSLKILGNSRTHWVSNETQIGYGI